MTEDRMFKVVIAGSGFENDAPESQQLVGVADVVSIDGGKREALLEIVADAHAILVDSANIDREVIEAAPKLKVVVGYGVGIDQIELKAATKRGVVVCNSPEGMSVEVAEHAIALLLALSRQAIVADADVRLHRIWNPFSHSYRPIVLRGKTLGIVGFGRIGSRTGAIAAGMGMKLLVFDPHINPQNLDIPDSWDVRFSGSLDELLGQSDAVTLHVPLTDETNLMINAEKLAKFRRGGLLVNVSRGGVVDQAALYDVLLSGQLAGAALDVIVPEPPNWDDPLLKLPNLILTPHIAWRSENSGRQMQSDAASEVRRVLTGETPKWRIS